MKKENSKLIIVVLSILLILAILIIVKQSSITGNPINEQPTEKSRSSCSETDGGDSDKIPGELNYNPWYKITRTYGDRCNVDTGESTEYYCKHGKPAKIKTICSNDCNPEGTACAPEEFSLDNYLDSDEFMELGDSLSFKERAKLTLLRKHTQTEGLSVSDCEVFAYTDDTSSKTFQLENSQYLLDNEQAESCISTSDIVDTETTDVFNFMSEKITYLEKIGNRYCPTVKGNPMVITFCTPNTYNKEQKAYDLREQSIIRDAPSGSGGILKLSIRF